MMREEFTMKFVHEAVGRLVGIAVSIVVANILVHGYTGTRSIRVPGVHGYQEKDNHQNAAGKMHVACKNRTGVMDKQAGNIVA